MTVIRIRRETRDTERRAPVAPADAARLVSAGIEVVVEESPQRVFGTGEYAAAGCVIAPAGSWVDAPAEEYVVGLKELPEQPEALRHKHVYFGHGYKGQPGAARLLVRFATGGGVLLDLEYLVDEHGRRLAAFGYWAGYVGAALAVLRHRGRLDAPLRPSTRDSLDALLASPGDKPRVLVVGALGRSGRGAVDALRVAGIEPTSWDLAETRVLDRKALLEHDILVNTVLVTTPVPPFLTAESLRGPHRLRLLVDVTCDVGSACNVVPVYDRTTTWDDPVRTLPDSGLDVIAIDNLPSLLPREASVAFSAELTPHLAGLAEFTAPWRRCLNAFRGACAHYELECTDA